MFILLTSTSRISEHTDCKLRPFGLLLLHVTFLMVGLKASIFFNGPVCSTSAPLVARSPPRDPHRQ